MRFSACFAVAALLGSAVASPVADVAEKAVEARDDAGAACAKDCMSYDEAKDIVDTYQRLIAAYTDDDGEKYVADSFIEYSDSINIFANQTLGGPTFPTKEIFMQQQKINAPTPLVVSSIDAVVCEVIALRWTATFGQANQLVTGITVLKTTKEKGYWQIREIDVEFNSLAYLLDIGGSFTV